MPSCFALFCSLNSGSHNNPPNINYYIFPKDSPAIKIWLQNAGMEPEMIEEYIPLIKADLRGSVLLDKEKKEN